MKTPPPDLTARLLAISADVLGTPSEPRLEDIARKVGASRATLYYYFSGREDLLGFLLTAHVEQGAARMREADDPARPPLERLTRVVTAMVAFLGEQPGICAGLLAALGGGDRMRPVLAANDARIAAPLRELLAEGRGSGALAFGDVADAANVVVGGVLMGVLGRSLSGADPGDPAFHAALTAQVVRGVRAT